jgi:anaerobic magnesium-protoporphyrin IX monomethyl ester cyclase
MSQHAGLSLIDHHSVDAGQRPARVILADVHGPVLGKDQPSPNLSLLYLAGYLQQHSPQVQLKYISQKPPAEYHLHAIAAFQADIYAVSFTSYSANVAFEMIRQVKQNHPNVLVVIGGPHVITHAEQAMRSCGADICVIGEGEITFNQIVNRYLELPRALPRINGIAYISNGVFKRTPVRSLIEDIDSIPFPARDLINQSDFAGTSYSKGRPNTEVIITRGCPLRCTFCANPVYRIEGGPLFRARSPESIALEVEQLYQMGYREIYFHSDELNVRLGWSIELCKMLANLGHRDLYFQCNMRVVPMSKELAYWMKRANFWLVRVGIESANERVLNGIRKRMSLAKTERACQLWSDEGIKVFAFLMMFNGWEQEGSLEHETVAEVRQTIRFVYRLWRKGYLHYASWTSAIPVPGAELYDLYVKFGNIDSNYLPDGDWQPYDHIDGLSRAEFNAVYKAALRQEALMALMAGNIEWRNWRMIAKNAWTMLAGKRERQSAVTDSGNAQKA